MASPYTRAAPPRTAHTREVLAGLLGYDDGRVKDLLAAGVIAAP